MSSINAQLQGSGYYQLNSSSSGNSATTAQTQVATPSLASALSGNTQSTPFSDAVLLDLSPAAQKYLSGLGTSAATQTQNTSTTSSQDFVLSTEQKQTLNDILAKYKDAPYTQDTFDAIQGDLQKAGLGPDQLSAKDRVNSFSATAVLVDALNGGNGSTPGSTPLSDADLKTKSNNYIQDVVSQWKKISTDYQSQQSASTGVTPVGSADGAS